MTVDTNKASEAVALLLDAITPDDDIRGTIETPFRVANMYRELLAGYDTHPEELLNNAMYPVEYKSAITVRDIQFYSLCEHHLLPFFGVVHVTYIPGEFVVGLSKISRFVEMFARRLQIQERMTEEIAKTIFQHIEPQFVEVTIVGQHFCMAMRGIQKQGTTMETIATREADLRIPGLG